MAIGWSGRRKIEIRIKIETETVIGNGGTAGHDLSARDLQQIICTLVGRVELMRMAHTPQKRDQNLGARLAQDQFQLQVLSRYSQNGRHEDTGRTQNCRRGRRWS